MKLENENTTPTLEPTSGENLTITSSTCHLHQDDAFEAIVPHLEAEGIEVISHDDHFVECPGQGLHTTPSATSDCKVYLNDFKGILIPRLYCFHRSCCEVLDECNRRLYRAALAGKLHAFQNYRPKSGGICQRSPKVHHLIITC